VLARLRRGHTVADVLRALDLCREHGMTPVVDFIVDLPVEDDEDILATLQLIRTVTRYGKAHVHSFMPLPGTPLAGESTRTLPEEAHRMLGILAKKGRVTGSWVDAEIRFFRRTSHVLP